MKFMTKILGSVLFLPVLAGQSHALTEETAAHWEDGGEITFYQTKEFTHESTNKGAFSPINGVGTGWGGTILGGLGYNTNCTAGSAPPNGGYQAGASQSSKIILGLYCQKTFIWWGGLFTDPPTPKTISAQASCSGSASVNGGENGPGGIRKAYASSSITMPLSGGGSYSTSGASLESLGSSCTATGNDYINSYGPSNSSGTITCFNTENATGTSIAIAKFKVWSKAGGERQYANGGYYNADAQAKFAVGL
jgi:hypothetical protein